MSDILAIAVVAAVALLILWIRARRKNTEHGAIITYSVSSAVSPSDLEEFTPSPPKGGLATYDIQYGDFNGGITQRRIKVMEIDAQRFDIYLLAWCFLRHDLRTFRADRILTMRTVPGGQVIPDPMKEIEQFIPAGDIPDPPHERFMIRARPLLYPLIWIARANNAIATEEMAVILSFLREYNAMRPSNPPLNEAKVPRFIDETPVTKASAVGALAEISQAGRIYKMIARHASALSEIEGQGNFGRYQQLFPPTVAPLSA